MMTPIPLHSTTTDLLMASGAGQLQLAALSLIDLAPMLTQTPGGHRGGGGKKGAGMVAQPIGRPSFAHGLAKFKKRTLQAVSSMFQGTGAFIDSGTLLEQAEHKYALNVHADVCVQSVGASFLHRLFPA
ncbi:hypothetical protein XENOCAPTIV_007733 [Xenoophorus captivus]|uniref:Uncharacterized protein n=1 Tax=Xenoophorus captivus TaxID=1517983 RepID=A0ABV0S0P9_9TELE